VLGIEAIQQLTVFTGSITTSTILGGLTYAAFHITEYWTTFDTTQLTVVSVILVLPSSPARA
jgi:hypothetical protein